MARPRRLHRGCNRNPTAPARLVEPDLHRSSRWISRCPETPVGIPASTVETNPSLAFEHQVASNSIEVVFHWLGSTGGQHHKGMHAPGNHQTHGQPHQPSLGPGRSGGRGLHCLDHSQAPERMQPDPQGHLTASQRAEEHPGGAHGEAGDDARPTRQRARTASISVAERRSAVLLLDWRTVWTGPPHEPRAGRAEADHQRAARHGRPRDGAARTQKYWPDPQQLLQTSVEHHCRTPRSDLLIPKLCRRHTLRSSSHKPSHKPKAPD